MAEDIEAGQYWRLDNGDIVHTVRQSGDSWVVNQANSDGRITKGVGYGARKFAERLEPEEALRLATEAFQQRYRESMEG